MIFANLPQIVAGPYTVIHESGKGAVCREKSNILNSTGFANFLFLVVQTADIALLQWQKGGGAQKG